MVAVSVTSPGEKLYSDIAFCTNITCWVILPTPVELLLLGSSALSAPSGHPQVLCYLTHHQNQTSAITNSDGSPTQDFLSLDKGANPLFQRSPSVLSHQSSP